MLDIQKFVNKLYSMTENNSIKWGYGSETNTYSFFLDEEDDIHVDISMAPDADTTEVVYYYLVFTTTNKWVINYFVDVCVEGKSNNEQSQNYLGVPSCDGIGKLYNIIAEQVKERISVKIDNFIKKNIGEK